MTLLIASLTLTGTLVASQPSQVVAAMARVSGQVIEDGTNTPVAGARVFLVLDQELPNPAPLPTTVTDRDGRYRFDTVPPGRYHIAAEKAAYAPPMEPSTMQMFEVSAGQVLDGLTVLLKRGGAVTGRVLDPLGQPIAGVGVTALLKRLKSTDRPAGPPSSGAPLLMPFGHSETSHLGEFRIVGLSPGEYVIAANPRPDFNGAGPSSPAPTIATSTFFPGTADVAAAQPVAVEAGETVRDVLIRLVTVPAFQVSGVVVDEAGAPVADAMVMLMGGHGGAGSLATLSMGPRGMNQSDAAGRFLFEDVPAGSYTLQVSDGPGGFFAISEDFYIGSDGTPRAGTSRPKPPAGTIEVIVGHASVTDLKLVVPRSP